MWQLDLILAPRKDLQGSAVDVMITAQLSRTTVTNCHQQSPAALLSTRNRLIMTTASNPQLVVHQFSMEALHSVMSHNNGQVLGLYGEMSVMYQQLDAYKHSGSTLDR